MQGSIRQFKRKSNSKMYKEIFSTPVPYRMPDDPTLTGPYGQLVYPPLLAYFTTPPRIYGEEFTLVNAMFVKKEATANSPTTIILNAITSNIYFPSVGQTLKFDGATGAFLGYGDLIGVGLDAEIVQSVDGSLWAVQGDSVDELDTTTYEVTQTIDASFFEIPPDQEFHGIAHPMFDRQRGLSVMSGFPPTVDARYILVNDLATGALIRRIYVSGPVAQIMQEDDRRCFVVCTNGMINVVDYTTGKILGTSRGPVRSLPNSFGPIYAWDFVLRRLLVFNFADGADVGAPTAPINADGSSPNTISGYYPIPIATKLTKPIPLTPPRKNRTTKLLSRLVGDAGEPIAGVRVAATADGGGSIVPSPQITDLNGEVMIQIYGADAADSTVTLSATV